MPIDKNSLKRDIEAYQLELDKVFHRVNEDPIYDTPKKVAEAISDNPRFFPTDRKMELAEILYSILDQIYERADELPTDGDLRFNPLPEGSSIERLPETEMLFRASMPLEWGLAATWLFPEMKCVMDEYISVFTLKEAELVYGIFDFLLELFPAQNEAGSMAQDVLEYWRGLAKTPELFHKETEEEKSRMLPELLAAAKKHNLF